MALTGRVGTFFSQPGNIQPGNSLSGGGPLQRRVGNFGLNVEIVPTPTRQVGSTGLNVDIVPTPSRQVGSTGLNVDIVLNPAREAGSVGANVDFLTTPQRELGAVGVNVEFSVTPQRQLAGIGVNVEYRLGHTVPVTIALTPQRLGRVVPATAVLLANVRVTQEALVAVVQQGNIRVTQEPIVALIQQGNIRTTQLSIVVLVGSRQRLVPVTVQFPLFRSVPATALFRPHSQLGGLGVTVDLASTIPTVTRELGSIGVSVDLGTVVTTVLRELGSIGVSVDLESVIAVVTRELGAIGVTVDLGFLTQSVVPVIVVLDFVNRHQRTVPATARLTPARERSVPVYLVFRWTQQRSVPARFIGHHDKLIPATGRFGGARLTRSVPAIVQLAQPTAYSRTVPLTLVTRRPAALARHVPAAVRLRLLGWVPVTAEFVGPSGHVVPLSLPARVTFDRTVPLRVTAGSTRPEQAVPATVRFVFTPSYQVPFSLPARGRGANAGEWIVAIGRLLLTGSRLVPLTLPIGDTRPGIHVTQTFLDVLTTQEDELAVTQFVIEVIVPRPNQPPYGTVIG